MFTIGNVISTQMLIINIINYYWKEKIGKDFVIINSQQKELIV